MLPSIATPHGLDASQLSSVRDLIAAVAREDGRDPLSDQALTHLASASVQHVLALDGERVSGYAQVDGRSLEVAAEPDAIGPLLDRFIGRSMLVWSHGHRSRLAPALAERGFTRERELHQLRRGLGEPIDLTPVPDGVQIRPFVVHQDEDEQLRVNAAAFAAHAEQGRWTRADLEAREREAWFDPPGFLTAWRAGRMIGFHWTKIHSDGVGEVYVLGIDPTAQGLGLGAVLLLRGLAHLKQRGCQDVLLYVDGSNSAAMRLYERYGFRQHDLDIQWQSPVDQPVDGAAQSSATGSVSKT